MKVIISEAAKQLCISETSILVLVKFHRIATDTIDGHLYVRDEDVDYFSRYLASNGKLPDLDVTSTAYLN